MMPERSRLRTRTTWTALFLALFLMPGLASAQLSKGEAKCVNTTNKGAQKVASAQGKDIAACIKDGAKENLVGTIEACLTSDPKGKVDKAKDKLDEKTAKDCGEGSGFVLLADPNDTKRIAMEKELKIIHWIFGTDLDTSVIKVSDPNDPNSKTNSKCQQAIAKAVFKCQDTKWKEFNACKKNALKVGKEPLSAGAMSSQELQDACLGVGTASIPDLKGKINKKCTFTTTIGKKCPDRDVFDGCPSPASDGELSDCIDQMIECELCLALQVIEGFNRSCDLFDDGVGNGSCPDVGLGPLGTHSSTIDPFAICVGGDNPGVECLTILPVSPDDPNINICRPPFGPTAGVCTPQASHLITSNVNNAIEIPSLTDSATEITCGPIDPNNGTATCTNVSLEIAGANIFPIGFLCFRPRNDLNCEPGLIDCDGGTPQDHDNHQKHDVAVFANGADPNSFPFTDCRVNPADVGDVSCFGLGSPACTANQTCSDMCDLYCASLGPPYIQEESGCEGICQGEDPNSTKFGATCQLHSDCAEGLELTIDDVSCAGGSLGAPHAGQCQCECEAFGMGAPGRPGALRIQTGLQAWIESSGPCDQTDITIVLEPDCVSFTTERSTATVLDNNAQIGVNWDDVPLIGDPAGGCASLATSSTSGSTLVGHSGNFDSGIGDVVSRSKNVTK